jgi:hypothetical protein
MVAGILPTRRAEGGLLGGGRWALRAPLCFGRRQGTNPCAASGRCCRWGCSGYGCSRDMRGWRLFAGIRCANARLGSELVVLCGLGSCRLDHCCRPWLHWSACWALWLSLGVDGFSRGARRVRGGPIIGHVSEWFSRFRLSDCEACLCRRLASGARGCVFIRTVGLVVSGGALRIGRLG